MRLAITGSDGFLGWHIRCRLKSSGAHEVIPVGRKDFDSPSRLAERMQGVDAVIHCAGVNRATPDQLAEGNLGLARTLTVLLEASGSRPTIVYANSIHCGSDTPFGKGKQGAADHLSEWTTANGVALVDVRLPNLFGEHGRPHYNSVVATFCHEIASGREPTVTGDRLLPLLHVQDAARQLIDLCEPPLPGQVEPEGSPMLISEVLTRLLTFNEMYKSGEIPELVSGFDLALFNTLRSFLFPAHYPLHPKVHSDQRGGLFDVVRSGSPEAQVFCSTTRPGFTRGEHFHLRKIERFLVIRGTARIALRRLFTDELVTFDVGGDRPAIVDMPTMWAHSITNTGSDELMTLFWANEMLDPTDTDTFPERVESELVAP